MSAQEKAIEPGPDGEPRCWWAVGGGPEYLGYHDNEWGRPVHDEEHLYERLVLEAFQSGLSWLTILRKRENFRRAFDNFDVDKVAAYGKKDVERLLADAGIVRNRKKIDAAITNARAIRELHEAGETLDGLLWSFAPDPDSRPAPRKIDDLEPATEESKAMAKELKRRGFVFVGPTTAYATMQAAGLVNDHLADCAFRSLPAA
jgi:DNA-3-methyladenine glycosylase I